MTRVLMAMMAVCACAVAVARPLDEHSHRMARRVVDSHATSMREHRVSLRDGEWEIVDEAAKRSGMTRDQWLAATILNTACREVVDRNRSSQRNQPIGR